jgi:hypothetical protein
VLTDLRKKNHTTFEVLTAVLLTMQVYCAVAACGGPIITDMSKDLGVYIELFESEDKDVVMFRNLDNS